MLGTRREVMNDMDERRPWEGAAAVLPGLLRAVLGAVGADKLDGLEKAPSKEGDVAWIRDYL